MTSDIEPLKVADPDSAWPNSFDRLAGAFKPFLNDAVVRIEHVDGQPRLAVKPFIDIDIDVEVESEQLNRPTIAFIESAGDTWVGDLDVVGAGVFDVAPDSPFA